MEIGKNIECEEAVFENGSIKFYPAYDRRGLPNLPTDHSLIQVNNHKLGHKVFLPLSRDELAQVADALIYLLESYYTEDELYFSMLCDNE